MSTAIRSMRFALALLPAVLLAACSDNDNGGDDVEFSDAAVIATRTAIYDAGAVALVSAEAPYTAQNKLIANKLSDIVVRSGGDHYFLIERGIGRISRYEGENPASAVYTYSTQLAGEAAGSNPATLVIVNDTKAYLLRYGSGKLWIVNPSASSEAAFKTGEIDLSHYDVDGVPEMISGLIKDGKLYVAMQRLESFAAIKNSYVAVIDTSTDQEVTTGSAAATLKGIELPLRNVGGGLVAGLLAIPDSSKILAFGPGDYGSFPDYLAAYDGGIATIDTTGYAASLLIDDGDSGTHPYGQIIDVAAVSASRAYFIGSTGFDADQTLYRFDPGSATPTPVAVSGYGPLGLGSLAVDPSGNLWVSRTDASAPGVSILGFTSNTETTVKDLVNTSLIPINIDFITVPKP